MHFILFYFILLSTYFLALPVFYFECYACILFDILFYFRALHLYFILSIPVFY